MLYFLSTTKEKLINNFSKGGFLWIRNGRFPYCYTGSGNYTDAEIDDYINQFIDSNYITISAHAIYHEDGFTNHHELISAKVNEENFSELFDD